ncbi:hypothetical protein [Bradyrhizobium sp.]|uniref:hypothetical protein n=1 Tax=Bradyrhizobium sp. TaxID=376 RepID=UPI002D1B37AB|nr:hypothetical protein [Bradyrhizobium sp.]HMM88801.1 hypothetical protein [Bradyrhizobium sp.]
MTVQQPIETPREHYMEVAQKEMIAFELKEREFSKKLRNERAEELRLLFHKAEFHS